MGKSGGQIGWEKYAKWRYVAAQGDPREEGGGVISGDCWAFVVCVMRDRGVKAPEGGWSWSACLAAERAVAYTIDPGQVMREGDVVLFSRDKHVHAGVAVDAFEFLHVEESGVVRRRIDVLKRAGLLIRVVRPHVSAGAEGEAPSATPREGSKQGQNIPQNIPADRTRGLSGVGQGQQPLPLQRNVTCPE